MPVSKEIRIAAVFYGGSSLAIYENGVAQELLRMVRATAAAPAAPYTGIEQVYADLAKEAGQRDWRAVRAKLEKGAPDACGVPQPVDANTMGDPPPGVALPVRFTVDVLSGTSAGGINGVFLAKALVRGTGLERLRRIWFEQADFDVLLNDSGSKEGELEQRLRLRKPPTSLLNSQRMYLELFQALRDMNDGTGTSLARRLDLFTTATDLEGIALPIRLSFQNAIERVHKFALHFSYRAGANQIDEFTGTEDPLLAFAARCTSSFPVAFEPMCLQDMDEILTLVGAKGAARSDDERWKKFFTHYVENGEEFVERAFADGGYLQNKPFSFAVNELLVRRSESRTERHLIFVDPFPELAGDKDATGTRPDAAANALDALTVLPRYQTIREEIDRILGHNREVRRLARLVRQVEAARQPESRPPGDTDWQQLSFQGIQEKYGEQYAAYLLLKVSVVSEEVALTATRALEWDERSSRLQVVRAIIRAWRDCEYGDDRKPDGKAKQPLTRFLDQFDLSYHIRRMDFVLRKIDELATLDPGALQLARLEPPRPEELPGWLALLNELREEAARSGNALCDAKERIWSDADEMRRVLVAIDLTKEDLNYVLGVNGTGNVSAGPPVSDDEAARRALVMLGCCNGGKMGRVNEAAATLRWSIKEATGEKNPNRFNRNLVTHEPPDLRRLRDAVIGFYDQYERYESLIFPISYGAEQGEGTEIRLVRISPIDTQEFQPGHRGPKLLGTHLGNFGAFLDRSWRRSDLLWGRIDAAEQLIHSVLPENDAATAARRRHYVQRAAFEIVQEELGSESIVRMKRALSAGVSIQQATQDELTRFGESLETELDGETGIRLAGRSTRVLGGVLEDVARVREQGANVAGIVARYTRWFWALIEISTPRSLVQLITGYLLQVLLLFEIFLVAGGTLLGNPGLQRAGWTLLAITLAVQAVVYLLGRRMVEPLRWLGAAIAVPVVAVFAIGVVQLPDFFQDRVWVHTPDTVKRFFDASVTPKLTDPAVGFTILLGLVGAAALVLSISMSRALARLRFSTLPNGKKPVLGNKLTEPGIGIELPETGDIEKVAGPPGHIDRKILAQIQGVDFGFIAAYVALFAGFGLISEHAVGYGAALALIVLSVAAGVGDIVEDLLILRALRVLGTGSEKAGIEDGVRNASMAKWGLLGGTLILSAYTCVALRMENGEGWWWWMSVIAMVMGVAGLLTIGGAVIRSKRRLIALSGIPLGVGLLLVVGTLLFAPGLFHASASDGSMLAGLLGML